VAAQPLRPSHGDNSVRTPNTNKPAGRVVTAIIIHGERAGGRAIGRPHAYQMADPVKDPAVAVQQARQLLLSGVWRTATKEGDDLAKATYLLRLKVPAALAVLPPIAIHARTKRPPPGGCYWCTVDYLAGLSFGKEVEPDRTDLLLSFLGSRATAARPATPGTPPSSPQSRMRRAASSR
jgi:hypothetical protein